MEESLRLIALDLLRAIWALRNNKTSTANIRRQELLGLLDHIPEKIVTKVKNAAKKTLLEKQKVKLEKEIELVF